jgi:hypothetical protein
MRKLVLALPVLFLPVPFGAGQDDPLQLLKSESTVTVSFTNAAVGEAV